MKYRIVENPKGVFYPQVKIFLFWINLQYYNEYFYEWRDNFYKTQKEAEDRIERDKQSLLDEKYKKIVYEE